MNYKKKNNEWVLGFISFIATIIALYLLGVPNRLCFVAFTVSMTIQGVIFYRTKQWWLIAQMVLLIFFNLVNWIRWTSQGVGM